MSAERIAIVSDIAFPWLIPIHSYQLKLMAPERISPTVVKRNPDLAKARILDAASIEFSTKGIDGARVDAIAARAKLDKKLIYHYFESKEKLYITVLEKEYQSIREMEIKIDPENNDPRDSLSTLAMMIFDYYIDHPRFIMLLNNENANQGKYIKKSSIVSTLNYGVIELTEKILRRGEEKGVFRTGVDPFELYLSMGALGYMYMSNRFTLSTVFGRDMSSPAALERRRKVILEMIFAYLDPKRS